jgi:hypothetical protein
VRFDAGGNVVAEPLQRRPKAVTILIMGPTQAVLAFRYSK